MGEAVWTGASGRKYTYGTYEISVTHKQVDGNYIFCKVVNNIWVPIYIGEGDLSSRIGSNHHQWNCIAKKGATHVHTHANAREADRRSEEKDLLAGHPSAYAPQGCNQKEGG